ncbi:MULTISPECIES: hypothetical protein [Odoribacteraceae]|uniref:hypothetical protein n=1 Tax=Odoribacteraceae TaxID=1853231 RepID=UPI000E50ED3D|nr:MULTISPECIES: hypothetical protein [Odoribacteraceae]MCQ4874240.1 hypothetical protein [Butyricimonas paravirosa]RHR74815.1 hypothetical protein DWW52_19105 [Odoribacter sp. AF15-53]
MIKQDYLIRMIQDFISRVAKAIMDRKKIRQQDWAEFDLLTQEVLGLPVKELTSMSVEELIDRYDKEEDRMSKIEFASMYLLKLSEEIEEDRVMKSKFRQDGMQLLKYVQKEDTNFSLQREVLVHFLETNSK